MKNHIKQMLRTPVQSVLIIVLVMIVTVMLSVGGNLWVASDRLAKIYEEDFRKNTLQGWEDVIY